MKTVDRSGDQMLGPNGRDDGALVSPPLQDQLYFATPIVLHCKFMVIKGTK